MKKVTMFLLAVLLIASLFVSCDTNTNAVLDEHVTVSFSTGSDGRSLGYEIENITNLRWHYSARKTSSEDLFKYGETSDTILANFSTQIELSQGKWDFTLWANKVEASGNEGAKVYEGSVTGVLITKETSPKSIVINVSPEVANVKGSIKFDGVQVSLKPTNASTPSTPVYAKTATIADVDGDINLVNGTAIKDNLTPGDYVVTVKYTEVVDGTTVTYASETIVVTVWSGRTTTIKGNLSEITGSATLNKIQTDITQENSVIEGEATEFALVGLAPSNNTESSEVNNTVVTFPAGTLSGENAKLQVKVNSIDSEFSFSASDTSSTVGSISLKLNDQESSSFTENVTITTYIAKGLSRVQVKYDGDPQEEITIANYNTDSEWTNAGTTEGYSKESGKLVFTTNHFSEYFVVADEVVAYNATTSTAYNDLNVAIEATDSGEVVKLIADYEIPQDVDPIEIGEEKNLTLDLNGKIITENGAGARKIKNKGTLTIRDSATNGEIKNNTIGEPGQDGSYGLIDNYGTLTIENGKFTDVSHGNGSSLRNRSGATLVINGGTFKNTADDSEKAQGGFSGSANAFVYSDGLDVRINGGTFTMTKAHYTPAIKIDGKGTIDGAIISTYKSGGIEVGGEVNIKNTEISVSEANSYFANAIAVSNDGKVNVYSGTFTGYKYGTYIYTSGGEINIYDGTFEAGTAVLKADEDTDKSYGSKINVYGGNFTGKYEINTKAELTIYSGTFSSDPSAYVDTANYNVTENGATWTVTAK